MSEMEELVRRTYWSGEVKVVVEVLKDEDDRDYYGCDVYTNFVSLPCAVYAPEIPGRGVTDEEALEDAARSALTFAEHTKGDVMGIADAAEVESIGKTCPVDRWKLEVVPTLTVFANHAGRDDDVWDAICAKLREAFPGADLWLETDDYSGDPEITIEPEGTIDETAVRRILTEGLS